MYMAAGPSSGGSGTIPLDALTSATGASLPGNRLGSPMLSQGQQQQLMVAAHAQAPQLAAIHGARAGEEGGGGGCTGNREPRESKHLACSCRATGAHCP